NRVTLIPQLGRRHNIKTTHWSLQIGVITQAGCNCNTTRITRHTQTPIIVILQARELPLHWGVGRARPIQGAVNLRGALARRPLYALWATVAIVTLSASSATPTISALHALWPPLTLRSRLTLWPRVALITLSACQTIHTISARLPRQTLLATVTFNARLSLWPLRPGIACVALRATLARHTLRPLRPRITLSTSSTLSTRCALSARRASLTLFARVTFQPLRPSNWPNIHPCGARPNMQIAVVVGDVAGASIPCS